MNLTEILEQHALWQRTAGSEGARADLHDADLRNADLRGADLYGADLGGADLHRANLLGADLGGAILHRADLIGADLRNANLRRAIGLPIAADAPTRLRAVARAALADPSALRMSSWHTCQTTHCIAGWAIHQAGELGRILEALHGSELAGRMLLGHEAALHFHDDDYDAREWLQSVLDAPEVAV